MQFSPEHIEAVKRRRRVVVNFDVTFAINRTFESFPNVAELVESMFGFADAADSQIDAIWWNWGEGNQVPYPSQHLPLYEHPLYQKWAAEGTDIVGLVLEATRKRRLEAFFSHRMNGSDNDLGPFARIPLKAEHPEWMFRTPWCTHEDNGYWNFALSEVHEHVLLKLGEVAQKWDFDGMELDFARGVVFPPGEGWVKRGRLTDFVRRLRALLLEVGARRGRPFLLAARVPETLMGAHFDGLDVEQWAREQLVDIFALGVRSFDVDLQAYHRIVAATDIRLYPSIDDHHAADGYQNPGIEILRGVAANWWQQGADGVHTFNFNYAENTPYAGQDWQSHLLAYREMGSPATLAHRDKVFALQRRGGGHGPTVIPNPEDWSTPRSHYANTCMLAPLPAPLDNAGKVDTLLSLWVGDDLEAEAEYIELVSVRLLLSDPAVRDRPAEQRLETVGVATIGHPGGVLHNIPALLGVEEGIEMRVNNILLDGAVVRAGWLVFKAASEQFAVGENLIGIASAERPLDGPQLSIEKLEVELKYRGQ